MVLEIMLLLIRCHLQLWKTHTLCFRAFLDHISFFVSVHIKSNAAMTQRCWRTHSPLQDCHSRHLPGGEGTEDMTESPCLLKLEVRKFSSTYHRVSVLLSEGELGPLNIPFLTEPSAFSTYLLHLSTTVLSDFTMPNKLLAFVPAFKGHNEN